MNAGSDDGPRPPEEAQLRDLLTALPDAELYKLLAVMYLGRGDFGAGGVEPMTRELAGRFPDRSKAIRHLMAKGPLGEYLSDGLRELQAAGIDIDAPEPCEV